MKVLLGDVDIVDVILLSYRQYDYVQVYINAMYNSMKLYINGEDVCECNARVLEVEEIGEVIVTLRVQDFRDVLANITENEVMLRVDEAGIWIGDFFLPNTLMF